MEEMHRKYHEVADIFPMMSGDEYEALKADIAENGQREPIWLHPDGRIIDGRNRHRACMDLGITPHFRTWNNGGSLVSFVVSLNLHRRHLSSSQKATIAVDILPRLEEEAKERQRLNALRNQPQNSQKIDYLDGEETGRAAAQAAELVGTNRQYVSDAKKLKEEAPALFESVRSGALSITQAKREHIRSILPEVLELPTNKYRVLYADPPWQYGNTQPDYHVEQADHYRLMTVKEIAAMPVIDIVEDNAVLFLWVTSPILEEAFEVVRAWGFKYKSAFIWDKVKHNMGHYNSVRHELLLICVRGSCQPDVQKLFDSVQSIERTEHSRKPEEFRTIIDTLYPYGKRVELFARRSVDNWEVWGNESSS